MSERVSEIYACKLAWSRWKEDREKGITCPPMKKMIFFCGVRALIERCREGIAELTWAGLPKVSCYTGTQSPLDIYHHLLHRLRQEWQVSCTTTEERRGPNGELRYYLGTLELLKRKKSTIKLPNSADTISTAVTTSTTARSKITSLYNSTCIWLIQGHAHKRNLSSAVCNLQEDDKKSDMNLTLCHN